jgi:hypothetical protein
MTKKFRDRSVTTLRSTNAAMLIDVAGRTQPRSFRTIPAWHARITSIRGDDFAGGSESSSTPYPARRRNLFATLLPVNGNCVYRFGRECFREIAAGLLLDKIARSNFEHRATMLARWPQRGGAHGCAE